MIDNKKIKEAAKAYEKNVQEEVKTLHNKLSAHEKGLSITYKSADACFIDGALWAIGQFLKDLWHDIKEEPRKGKWIVTRYLNDDNDYVYEVDLNTSIMSWEEYTRKYRITQWLYIEDLFPKDRI